MRSNECLESNLNFISCCIFLFTKFCYPQARNVYRTLKLFGPLEFISLGEGLRFSVVHKNEWMMCIRMVLPHYILTQMQELYVASIIRYLSGLWWKVKENNQVAQVLDEMRLISYCINCSNARYLYQGLENECPISDHYSRGLHINDLQGLSAWCIWIDQSELWIIQSDQPLIKG